MPSLSSAQRVGEVLIRPEFSRSLLSVPESCYTNHFKCLGFVLSVSLQARTRNGFKSCGNTSSTSRSNVFLCSLSSNQVAEIVDLVIRTNNVAMIPPTPRSSCML